MDYHNRRILFAIRKTNRQDNSFYDFVIERLGSARMFLSKYSSSRQLYSKLVERSILTRSASSATSVHHPPSDKKKQYQTPLSLDPEFKAPPDGELPRAKTTEMKGITFNVRDFYKNYFPNDPVEARSPTPWHMDVYYRKQYYLIVL